jgi:dolichyl-phosphate beta-glucosyltransferase
VVDDGSVDKTREIIKSLHNNKIILTDARVNRGKGFSVREGVLKSTGELVLFTDADLSTPIGEFDKLAEHIEGYDIVIGSRAAAGAIVKTSFIKKILGRIGNLIIKLLIVKNISDTQCGFKLFKKNGKRLFRMQRISGFGFDFEILFLAQKNRLTVKEVPVVWTIDSNSKVKLIDYPKTLLELITLKINYLIGAYKENV